MFMRSRHSRVRVGQLWFNRSEGALDLIVSVKGDNCSVHRVYSNHSSRVFFEYCVTDVAKWRNSGWGLIDDPLAQ